MFDIVLKMKRNRKGDKAKCFVLSGLDLDNKEIDKAATLMSNLYYD